MVLNLNWRIRNAESFASLLDVDFKGRPLDLPLLDVARMAAGSDRELYQRRSTPINWLVGLTGTLLHRCTDGASHGCTTLTLCWTSSLARNGAGPAQLHGAEAP